MLHVFDARAILVGVKHDIVVLGEGVDGHRLQTTRQPFRSMRGRVEAVHEALRVRVTHNQPKATTLAHSIGLAWTCDVEVYLCAHQGAFLTGRTHVDLVPSVLGADEAMLFDVPLPEHLTEFIVLLHSLCSQSRPKRERRWRRDVECAGQRTSHVSCPNPSGQTLLVLGNVLMGVLKSMLMRQLQLRLAS